jgi:hypothetical protein
MKRSEKTKLELIRYRVQNKKALLATATRL